MSLQFAFEVEDGSGWRHERLPAEIESVAEAVKRLANGAIGTLKLSRGGEELWASGGPNQFSVWAVTGPDNFFDLVGNPNARGSTELIIGGQRVDHPRRHSVDATQVQQTFWLFLTKGHVPVSDGQWDAQGANPPE